MMRNVAIGAVVGFAVMVVLLTVFNNQPPPPAPPPAAAEASDAGMPAITTLELPGTVKIVNTPRLMRDKPAHDAMMRSLLQQSLALPAGADAGP